MEASKIPQTITFQGFLIPESYKNQVAYRGRPLFRSAFPLLSLTIITASYFTYQYLQTNKLKEQAQKNQAIITAESATILKQNGVFKPTRDQYNELDTLRKNLRIPVAPILDSIEKTIPHSISINRLTLSCPPIATTTTTNRKANITIEVFFPDPLDPNEDSFSHWPDTIAEYLSKASLQVTNSEWSLPHKYIAPILKGKNTEKTSEVIGKLRELSLVIEQKS